MFSDLSLSNIKHVENNVYTGFHKDLKKTVIIKCKDKHDKEKQQLFLHEVKILNELKNINVAEMIKQSSNHVILKYYEGGDLFSLVVKHGYLQEIKALNLFLKILILVESVHKKNIIHRDIKLENIVLTSSLEPFLIDFEYSTQKSKVVDDGINHYCIGTPDYISPEMLFSTSYTHTTDIWSLGILLYIISTGRSPYGLLPSKSFMETELKMKKGKDMKKYNCSTFVSKLIDDILVYDPEDRPSIRSLISRIQSYLK